jgi:hypothetical protein
MFYVSSQSYAEDAKKHLSVLLSLFEKSYILENS